MINFKWPTLNTIKVLKNQEVSINIHQLKKVRGKKQKLNVETIAANIDHDKERKKYLNDEQRDHKYHKCKYSEIRNTNIEKSLDDFRIWGFYQDFRNTFNVLLDENEITGKVLNGKDYFIKWANFFHLHRNPDATFFVISEINLWGDKNKSNMLRICRKDEVRIIFKDSDSIFQNYKELPEEELKRLTKESIQFVNKIKKDPILWKFFCRLSVEDCKNDFHDARIIIPDMQEKFFNHCIYFDSGEFKHTIQPNKKMNYFSRWFLTKLLIYQMNLTIDLKKIKNFFNFNIQSWKLSFVKVILSIASKLSSKNNKFINEANNINYCKEPLNQIQLNQWVPGDGVNYPMFRLIIKDQLSVFEKIR